MTTWTKEQEQWLIDNYPTVGKKASCEHLNKSDASIRQKTSRLGLKQDRSSSFFKDWQERAGNSKIGKKRPAQALVMKKLHQEGKLKITEEGKIQLSIKIKERFRERGHPRGALGMRHTPESLALMSISSKKMWKDKDCYMNTDEYRQMLSDRQMKARHSGKIPNGYSRGNSGKREDINGIYFRSMWEANYARYLNFLLEKKIIYKWEFEPDRFIFHEVRRGIRSYCPDFKIWEAKDAEPYYVEVKGYMDDKSKTRHARMDKYYPEIKIIMFMQKDYKELKEKLSRLIPGWESDAYS